MVEADAGGEGEQSQGDPGVEVAEGACAVAFEAEQVFECEEDRFDPLPDDRDAWPCLRLVFACWPGDRRAEGGDGGCEFSAGVAFVADDRFAADQCRW